MIITKAEYNWMKKLSEKKKSYLDNYFVKAATQLHEGKTKLCNFCDKKAIGFKKQMFGETFNCKKHDDVGSMVGAGYITYYRMKGAPKDVLDMEIVNYISRNQ